MPRAAIGRASGFERAGDNAGAVVGPLLAAALVGVIGLRHTIMLALIPGLLAAAAITIAAREARRVLREPSARRRLSFSFAQLHRAGVTRAFVPVALFELGNVATTLLILRSTDLLHTDGSHPCRRRRNIAVVLLRHANDHRGTPRPLIGGGRFVRPDHGPSPCSQPGAVGLRPRPTAPFLIALDRRRPVLLGRAPGLAGSGHRSRGDRREASMVALMLPITFGGNGFGVLGIVPVAR